MDVRDHPLVEQARLELLSGRGAKRLRALLPTLIAQTQGRPPSDDSLLWLGLAAELMHAGTLCHDDLIDGDTLRRERPTAWARIGQEGAIVLGDYLLFLAQRAIHRSGLESTRMLAALDELGRTAQELALGQAMENDCCRSQRLPTLSEYRELACGKTGSLFALPAAFASLELEVDQREALRALGSDFGVLFQLVDDFVEHTDPGQAPVSRDLQSARISWVASACLAALPPELHDEFRARWFVPDKRPGDENSVWIEDRIRETGAAERTIHLARQLMSELETRAGQLAPRLAAAFRDLLGLCPGAGVLEAESDTCLEARARS